MRKLCVLGSCWLAMAAGGCAEEPASAASPQSGSSVFRAAAVRYQVTDVARAAAFYAEHLEFQVVGQSPAFAEIESGPYTLWLSGPGSSGARPMPDGTEQAPGGWNRLVLEVDDIHDIVARMKEAGLPLRNEIEVGPGGQQIQLEDPDGNPIELFQRAR